MIDMTETTNGPDTNRPPLSAPILDAAREVWSQAGEQHFIPITGRSMLPLIRAGDRVLVAHGSADVQRGDVIVFQCQGRLVAHRVLRVECHSSERVFLTKGDNSRHFDPLVNAKKVVGRALAVEREGRRISLDTAPWRVMGWLIALVTLGWTRLYARGRAIKRRFFGSRRSRLAVLLRRGVRVSSRLTLKFFQMLFSRGDT
jgi:signal peptidase I